MGGVMGTAVLNGVKRGIFSNESGQGTGPHPASSANVKHPAEQGLVQAFSVYFDTLLVCSATGFMILLTDSYNMVNGVGEVIYTGTNGSSLVAGPEFTQAAVSTVLGDTFGPMFVAISLFFFAFTTLTAYYYIAECNAIYLTTKKNKLTGKYESRKALVYFVKIIFLIGIVFFSSKSSTVVWNFADIGIGMMAWYNIIGILIIGEISIKTLKDYDAQLDEGVTPPTFNPRELGIDSTNEWT